MPRYVAITASAVLVGLLAVPANAQPKPKPTPSASGENIVVLAPIATLGSQSRSKRIRKTRAIIARGLGTVPNTRVLPARRMLGAIAKARKPELRTCDGEAPCLSELGALLGGTHVVSAELGGLGAARVVYLKVVHVASKKELRSTTLELGGKRDGAEDARAAAYRLLAPALYQGKLAIKVDVEKAEIFVDGRRVGRSPAGAFTFTVGTHALRVTHPEFRDFVRFVDVKFSKTETVSVKLQQFPIVSRDMKSSGGNGGAVSTTTPGGDKIVFRGVEPTPWYKKWYTVAGAGALVFIGSAVVVGLIADGIDSDRVKTVGDGN